MDKMNYQAPQTKDYSISVETHLLTGSQYRLSISKDELAADILSKENSWFESDEWSDFDEWSDSGANWNTDTEDQ
jgi:hypothetical protein